MRTPMTLKWIEGAEARKILTMALSEAPAPSASAVPSPTTSLWGEFLRRWSSATVATPGSRRARGQRAGSSRPQQIGERRDAGQPPEIADDAEADLDAVRLEAGQRRQGAELGVDIRPVDAEHARPFRCIDGAGNAASVPRADRDGGALPIALAVVGGG